MCYTIYYLFVDCFSSSILPSKKNHTQRFKGKKMLYLTVKYVIYLHYF